MIGKTVSIAGVAYRIVGQEWGPSLRFGDVRGSRQGWLYWCVPGPMQPAQAFGEDMIEGIW